MDIQRLNRPDAATYTAWQFVGDQAALTLSAAAQRAEFGDIFADDGADYFAVFDAGELAAVMVCEFPEARLHLKLIASPSKAGIAEFASLLVPAAVAFSRKQYRYEEQVVLMVPTADLALMQAAQAEVGVQVRSFERMRQGD